AFSQAILIEASLSYLGLSAQPPTPSWGNMLNEGRTYLETAPWISVFPGIAIMVSVLAFNLIGDGLRDILDPNVQWTSHRRYGDDDPREPQRPSPDRRRGPRRVLGRRDRARADAEARRHVRLGADDGGDGPRPAARPGVLAEPPLAHAVQPARPLRRRHESGAGAGRVLAREPGRPHVGVQAPRGRALPRRPGADVRRRQVHVRPALREVARKVRFHRRRPGRARGPLRGEVRDEGALRRAPRGPRRVRG